MTAAKQLRYLRSCIVVALAVIGAASFSAASLAATTLVSFQVSAVVQNSCNMALKPQVSAPLAVPKNLVTVNCQYGQSYTVAVQPVAVDVGTAPGTPVAPVSGNATIVTVTY